MKKTIMSLLACCAALLLVTGVSFAGTDDCTTTVEECDNLPDTNGGGPSIDLKFSPNVLFGYQGAATAYAMATKNSSGTKGYGATSASQGLYVTKADLAADAVPTVPAAGDGFPTADWALLGK